MKLKDWRIRRKWSQAKLAAALNTTQESISYWENEEVMPTKENIQAIMALTKRQVTANDFV